MGVLQQDPKNEGKDSAKNIANHEKYKEGLTSQDKLKHNKELSLLQMKEEGKIIAGEGGKELFKDASRIVNQYGGDACDWVKKTSSKAITKDGNIFETHWIENLKTGQRVEYKTKFP